METQIYTAWNPDTEQGYEIKLPAPETVRQAILELDFPTGGFMNREVADRLATRFQLSDEQKNALAKMKDKAYIFRDQMVLPTLRQLLKDGKLEQPEGPMTPYFLAGNVPLPPSTESDLTSNLNTASEESIDTSYKSIRERLAKELLQNIRDNTPTFFEKLVIDLLVKMGYGGSREDAGKAVGGSGDGGIDGIINEDKLGLDMIYVQAKRWTGNVGEPPVRDFVGALDGEGVQKGVFITTSNFNPSAKNFAERTSKRIILIDGNQLAQLMIDHNVGVSIEKTYEIKRVDSDYFAENTE